jgi:ribosomal protein S18 acetylase RimI-like enzyme
MSPLEQLRAMPGFARVIGWNRIRPGMKLIEHLDALHARLAPGPHVYLYVLGVEPRQQGRGVARRLLEPMLARCDAVGHDVYLETAKAKNVQFYERYGFELRGVAEHPGLPSLWGMFRPGRSAP